ncbi:MAG: RNA polymerase sigma factor [Armatimonadetes bacterium]|nr:RNA polymerase sigma factor [Anaerolineae bacterium]
MSLSAMRVTPPSGTAVDPDWALIQRMAAGETAALDELYAQHGRRIFGYLLTLLRDNRVLAEEVLQDVMLAAWENAANFRGDSKVRTWLLVIARNRALNSQRKRAPLLVELDDNLTGHDDETGPLERVQRQDEGAALRRAIETLPVPHQTVLVLVFYQQLSGVEVAQVLGISEGTVKSRLHRAKAALRRALHMMGETDEDDT